MDFVIAKVPAQRCRSCRVRDDIFQFYSIAQLASFRHIEEEEISVILFGEIARTNVVTHVTIDGDNITFFVLGDPKIFVDTSFTNLVKVFVTRTESVDSHSISDKSFSTF